MGNAPSHNAPRSNQDPSSLPTPPSRSRPLKQKKRSIVAHPPLALQGLAIPSNPIPIPNNNPSQPRHLNTPPDTDIVSELINRDHRPDSNNNHTHRPLQYNSTRSFGQVRRGGIQGGGWSDHQQGNRQQSAKEEPMEEIVRSSIPLRLPQAEREAGILDDLVEGIESEDEDKTGLIPTTITWHQGGNDVFIAGTLNELEWRARERLRYDSSTNTHGITIPLSPGTYRIKFIVDDVWCCASDLPTATDDTTGNLVNYIVVEDTSALDLAPGQSDERQGRDARVMKANRKRTYPVRASRNPGKSPTTSINPGKAWHPPLLPPSDSFWGIDPHENSGWEHGRDGVLEKWTSIIPEPLVAAAHQEESYLNALQAERDARRGGAGSRGTVGALGMGVPLIPPAPRLPRHLERLILNMKSNGNGNGTGSGGSRSSRSGRHRSTRASSIGMTSLLSPPGVTAAGEQTSNVTGMEAGLSVSKSGSMAVMEQWASADDTSVLPVPSHVVLHHLGTSAIRNGVLAVSDTTRYNKKYITTIYYKPT